ncbi:band 4.1-like protein 4 [Schistocerca serialis cubense]|uniref:band 4.1-like protein 4 n=1 Tax=Schistocerca serialis cubense TaxID=2023355 RepID=UPI00214E281E|nr:band 4.1-like protein 4 [Schistocerca serialis cubense]
MQRRRRRRIRALRPEHLRDPPCRINDGQPAPNKDNSPGQEILDTVFRHLNLLETAYFGLRYLDASNQTHWLDPAKKIAKQLKGTDPFTLYFGVKFYAADPCKLLEEITRYQFFLQVKQDILQGRLPVTFDLAAELGAYVVQSELGDYDPRRHSPGYVSEFRFLSNQTVELESRIAELHKGLVGQLPAVAELNYLDKVKWLEMYGVDLHPVLGEDNVEYFLGLTPSGIIVLRNKNKVGNYYWPRITKIYFKGRYFMLRVCDKNNDENTYGFETPSKSACKHLWKCCVEHHAFFRLVQVSPTTPDIFSLGSRFRYSGRTEKQAQRDAQLRLRSPPQFTRTPSRRYQRRIVEGAQDAPKVEETLNKENAPPPPPPVQELKPISTVPQPIPSVSSLYRSTCSIPAALPSTQQRADSPRSTRSAPWTQPVHQPHMRGLYSSSSPRSVRSAGHHNSQLLSRLTRRSSSVESQSSNDSRSCKRHRHHRSRRSSDNESELSKGSGSGKSHSHGHRRHRHRSHGTHRRESSSEQDSHHRHRHKSSSKHRHSSHYELVDSEAQWKEVQRKQAEGGTGIHKANVIPSRRSGYMNSGMETESELSYHQKRKQKKHRSRSRSPSETKPRLPDELKKHLEFDLIDTEGMSEAQLREIPYKVVETNSKALRVKLSPTSKRRQRSPRRTKSCSTPEEKCQPPSSGDSPPPPYSPPDGSGPPKPGPLPPGGGGNSGTQGGAGSGLTDFLNKNSGSSSASPAGSLRIRNTNTDVNGINNNSSNNSNSNNNNSSNNNHLPRLSTALNVLEYRGSNVSGSSTSRAGHPRAFSSALYDNPTTLLGGKTNGHLPQNINNLKASASVSHEHSDSGLSAESQDYSLYSTARSNDGPKYAQTTKLSTVSVQPPLPSLVSKGGGRDYSQQQQQQQQANTRPFHQPTSHSSQRQWEDGSSGLYRSSASNVNNNWSQQHGGSGGRRRGPLYYQQSSGILRDSNKFNTSTMSSVWSNDTETICEDEEPLETQTMYKPNNGDSSSSKSDMANGHEVAHEMSTEL